MARRPRCPSKWHKVSILGDNGQVARSFQLDSLGRLREKLSTTSRRNMKAELQNLCSNPAVQAPLPENIVFVEQEQILSDTDFISSPKLFEEEPNDYQVVDFIGLEAELFNDDIKLNLIDTFNFADTSDDQLLLDFTW